jgi:dihydroneopterin aldolase
MNAIFIHDLRVKTRIGVYDWEQHLPQTLRLDVEFDCPRMRFRSGDFADALDYAAVVRRLQGLADDHPYKLLEPFAQAVAEVLLDDFAAPWVKVRVAARPDAGVKELGVAIERGAPDHGRRFIGAVRSRPARVASRRGGAPAISRAGDALRNAFNRSRATCV